MDAKKKALIEKPLYLTDTKAYKNAKYLYVGVLAYTFICAYIAYTYDKNHPDRLWKNNPISRYFKSQEFLMKEARLIGIFSPSFEESKLKVNKSEQPLPRGSAGEF